MLNFEGWGGVVNLTSGCQFRRCSVKPKMSSRGQSPGAGRTGRTSSTGENSAAAAIRSSLSAAKRAVLANGIYSAHEPCFILLRAQKHLVRILKHSEERRSKGEVPTIAKTPDGFTTSFSVMNAKSKETGNHLGIRLFAHVFRSRTIAVRRNAHAISCINTTFEC